MARGYYFPFRSGHKNGLKYGRSTSWVGVAREEQLACGFIILNSMLGFGLGEGAVEAGVLADCSA